MVEISLIKERVEFGPWRGAQLRCRCSARLGARAGRAQPGAGWAGASPGRSGDAELRGRRWAASGDHRGSIRASCGTRAGGRSPIPHDAREAPMRSQVRPPLGEVTGASSGLRDESRRRVRIASGVPETRRALPPVCACRPRRGTSLSVALARIAWYDTNLDRMESVSVRAESFGEEFAREWHVRAKRELDLNRRATGGTPPRVRAARDAGIVVTSLGREVSPDHSGALASSSSPSTDFVTDRPSSRSLSRSVRRAIPRVRAAWTWLPSVDRSTSGRRNRSSSATRLLKQVLAAVAQPLLDQGLEPRPRPDRRGRLGRLAGGELGQERRDQDRAGRPEQAPA